MSTISFVGLLIARKLCKEGDENSLHRVLDAVGTSFLERLLLPLNRSNWLDEDRVEIEVKLSSMALAFSLLKTFAAPSIVQSNALQFISLIPYACKIWENKEWLAHSISSSGLNIQVLNDMLQDALHFALGVWNDGLADELFKRYLQMTLLALQHPGSKLVAIQLADCLFADSRINRYTTESMNLLLHLSYLLVLPDFSKTDEASKEQLEALKTIDQAFTKTSKLCFMDCSHHGTVLMNLRTGLCQIFTSKISPGLIHLVMHLIVTIIDLIGINWMIPTLENGHISTQFLNRCGFHTRVELSLQLCDLRAPGIGLDDNNTTTGDRVLRLLPNYLSLTESLIDLLVLMESQASLPDETIMDLFHNLDETTHELVLFIKDLQKNGNSFLDEHPYLLIGCIRLLGRYLAEAPSAHEEQVVPLIPFMLSCAQGEGAKFLLPALQQQFIAKSSNWKSLWNQPIVKTALQLW
eukprot:g5145.t1